MSSFLCLPDELKAQNVVSAFGGNGSFEEGTDGSLFSCNQFTDPTCSLNNGNRSDSGDRLPGWLAHYNDGYGGVERVIRSPLAQDGERMLLLHYSGEVPRDEAWGSVTTLREPVLTVGQTYELSFWAAAAMPDKIFNGVTWQNRVGVNLYPNFLDSGPLTFILPSFSGDENLFTRTEPLDWQHYTFNFVAASEVLNLSITGGSYRDARPPLQGGVYVDNVSLALIPEPGSALMIAVASMTLAVRRRNTTRRN